MNIAFIDLNEILDRSKKGKSLSQRLRQIDEKYQIQLQPLKEKSDRIQKSLNDPTTDKGADLLFKLRRDQRLVDMELQSFRERAQFEIESSRSHFRELLLLDLKPMIADLAASEGLDLVITLPNPSIPFFNTKLDLTDSILSRFDQYSK
jgi:outer membrane protein